MNMKMSSADVRELLDFKYNFPFKIFNKKTY